MKKYIVLILSVLSLSANAESVNLEEMKNFENQTRERFSPPDVVKQLL